MNVRDILTLVGLGFLAVGPVLMHHVGPLYTVGEVITALGPVLIGYRALTSNAGTPPPTNLPK